MHIAIEVGTSETKTSFAIYQSMRKRLRADFSDAQRLHTSPKARLVNPKYRPNQFGASSGECSVGMLIVLGVCSCVFMSA